MLDRTSQAYHDIKRQIIELTLPPGSRFSENSLAQQWEISKTPVREALARLRRDGYVEALPRAGYVVSPITLKDTGDLCSLRTLLSGSAAESAARRGLDPERLARLEELAQVPYLRKLDDDGREDALRVGLEFEAIIANASGNLRLSAAIVNVLDELERVLRLVGLLAPNVTSPPGELEAVSTRLSAADPEGARSAMQDRCERVRRDLLAVLAQSDSVIEAPIAMVSPPGA